ncbi:MAG: permease [Phycisphaerae bacterium]|nr:permease [Phycisphaerae bacterium]
MIASKSSFFVRIYGYMAMKQWSAPARAAATLGIMLAVFLAAYFLPFESLPAGGTAVTAGRESLLMLQDYARHHVMLCLVPALFIAGAISCFVSQAAVMKYFGARAHKAVAYTVAAVSGTILAACSCTILPLFAGIYKRGAGLGPATAFLYSGPAINALAIILTARVLGWELGLARAIGAIVFSVVIGLSMHLIYRKEEAARQVEGGFYVPDDASGRSLWQNAVYFAAMIGILVFANWAKPTEFDIAVAGEADIRAVVLGSENSGGNVVYKMQIVGGQRAGEQCELDAARIASMTPVPGLATSIWHVKWWVTGSFLTLLVALLMAWFARGELREWVGSTWVFAKQILPLLFVGVLVAGVLLGRPGHPALIPESWIAESLGGNSLRANLFASVAGALMYFATLTEVPILQGLLGAGMGKGPALALLLAGPALSLPSMLVIRSVMGTRKTLVYVSLVVVLSTVAGMSYGAIATQGV